MNEWEWQLLEDKAPVDHLLIAGIEDVPLVIDVAMPLDPIDVLHARGASGDLRTFTFAHIARRIAAPRNCEREREHARRANNRFTHHQLPPPRVRAA